MEKKDRRQLLLAFTPPSLYRVELPSAMIQDEKEENTKTCNNNSNQIMLLKDNDG